MRTLEEIEAEIKASSFTAGALEWVGRLVEEAYEAGRSVPVEAVAQAVAKARDEVPAAYEELLEAVVGCTLLGSSDDVLRLVEARDRCLELKEKEPGQPVSAETEVPGSRVCPPSTPIPGSPPPIGPCAKCGEEIEPYAPHLRTPQGTYCVECSAPSSPPPAEAPRRELLRTAREILDHLDDTEPNEKACVRCGKDAGRAYTYESRPHQPLEGPICDGCKYPPAAPSLPGVVEALERAEGTLEQSRRLLLRIVDGRQLTQTEAAICASTVAETEAQTRAALQALRSQGEAAPGIAAVRDRIRKAGRKVHLQEPAPEDEGGEGGEGGDEDSPEDPPGYTYFDLEGKPCSLDTLCRKEPAWAANIIRGRNGEVDDLQARVEALQSEVEEWQTNHAREAEHANKLQQERDEARERVKELEVISVGGTSKAWKANADALIEAAVAWKKRGADVALCIETLPAIEGLQKAVQPFLPAPQPSRVELLEELRTAVDAMRASFETAENSGYKRIATALRAVESAERGEEG